MRTIIRGRGEESFAWYHVIDYQKRGDSKHFNRAWFVHIGQQCLSFGLSGCKSLALLSLTFSSTSDDDFSLSVALWKLFYFHFSIAHLPIVQRLPGVKYISGAHNTGEREIRLSWRPWSWHWNIWTDPNESRRCWRDGWFDLADFLLGPEKYSEIRGVTQDIIVPMPEGNYPAKVAFVQRFWKRRRWPTVRTRTDADIELPLPIPSPGKGENAWDVDDDALYGINCAASTVEEAIAHVQASAMRDRRKYAGAGWIPDAGWLAVNQMAGEGAG